MYYAIGDKTLNVIDRILTHKVYGIIIFLIVVWLLFQATFGVGYFPMLWIEKLVFVIEEFLHENMAESVIKSLLLNGVIKSIGGVIIFLPNIVILFSLLFFLEGSGYMARVTLVMDKLLKPLGLSGRSFLSLVMGLGCNVPAIMAASRIENRSNRIITIIINPLMPCSSRFTVFVLFISAFFPHHSGTVLFCIYSVSVIIAAVFAFTLKRISLLKSAGSIHTDIPAFSIPSFMLILKSIWFNTRMFLQKITGAILIASVVIWALSYYPNNSGFKNIDQSYIGMFGRNIEPIIAPLGFDWKMGISLISGIVAKETILGTLNELYQDGHQKGDNKNVFISTIKSAVYDSGTRKGQLVFNPLVALSFIFFVSIYTPCIATLAAVRKTTKSRKWTLLVIGYTSILAWIISLVIYQAGSLFT